MEQQSSAWKEWRKQGIGGSDVAAILGLSKWMTKLQLFQYKTGLAEQPDLSGEWHVQRGIENEGKVRAQLELLTGVAWPAELAVHPVHSFMRVSLDGRAQNRICEIKITSKEVMELAEKLEVPDYYMAQVQYQLMVTGADECVFFCFNEKSGKFAAVPVKPSKEWFGKIEPAVIEFWNENVLKKIAPDPSERDFVEITDPSFESSAILWRAKKESLKLLEQEIEEIETGLQTLLDKYPAVTCGGVKITTSTRKGTVEYAKIPELKGVNLELYRKAPTKSVSIRPDRSGK
jgi:putative phage-type endonuclease